MAKRSGSAADTEIPGCFAACSFLLRAQHNSRLHERFPKACASIGAGDAPCSIALGSGTASERISAPFLKVLEKLQYMCQIETRFIHGIKVSLI